MSPEAWQTHHPHLCNQISNLKESPRSSSQNFRSFKGDDFRLNQDATGKSQIKHLNTSNEVNETEHSRLSNSDVDFGEKSSLVQDDKTKTTLSSKKLHKLHWGLDTKEPWERKANM
ncbi:uncharacterized protein LOC103485441 isoform X2 [Cucumis melo]|uniref:Uncharacterized protein LOC103485441 isoform X2 n=1 Tax=Cucumis melo TaxID=3656 RepID=A0ABM3KJI8_CUCME|nr:uncharacterized protein LOC103485441 isoform X2 [Cucumis melo]XP_050937951.1 uncharacterized protein LOC103485441 isoform X2 [Cucumis melo]